MSGSCPRQVPNKTNRFGILGEFLSPGFNIDCQACAILPRMTITTLDTQVVTKADVKNLENNIKAYITRIEKELLVIKLMVGLVIVVNVIPFVKSFLG